MSKVFNMVGGGGGPYASIFVTGLSETDTVTATNGSKTLTGKWKSDPNPAWHGLPDGYTQLEWIGGSGDGSTAGAYINTNVTSGNGYSIRCKMSTDYISSNTQSLFGVNSSSNENFIYHKGGKFTAYLGGTATSSFLDVVENQVYEIEFIARIGEQRITIDGVNYFTGTNTTIADGTIFLFANDSSGSPQNYSKVKFHGEVEVFDNSQNKIRDYVPCKRNSDSAIGLYDLVSGTFFENAGTGDFIAGAEVQQTVDGFLIKPIRDFGTWTVTATDGVQTTTQDVLVDVITNYEIEMTYKPVGALYWCGDECEDITGGWTNSGYTNNSVDMRGGEKRSKSLYFANTGTDNYAGFGTVNTVNLNSINGIKVEVVSGSFGGYDALLLTKSKTNYAVSANEVKELRLTDTGTFALDVSEITTSVYIMLRCGSGTTLEIGKVWLE